MKKLNEVDLIFEGDGWMIVQKPAGMLVQNDGSEDLSLLHHCQKYLKKEAHIHTRLDRPVSGLVLISYKPKARSQILDLQKEKVFSKKYIAVVSSPNPIADKGELHDFHFHNKKLRKAEISKTQNEMNKKVSLSFTKLCDLDNYSVLELKTDQGRFHQIRAQLSFNEMIIKNDIKYGARRSNKNRSIYLHAQSLSFTLKGEDSPREFLANWPDDSLWQIIENKINQESE